MNDSRVVGLAVALSFLWTSCKDSPSDVFEKLQDAAKKGHVEEFGSYFTDESRPFAEALLYLYKAQSNPDLGLPEPLKVLALARVDSERIEGQKGVVVVESGGRKYSLVFKKDGKWRLDLKLTELENARTGF